MSEIYDIEKERLRLKKLIDKIKEEKKTKKIDLKNIKIIQLEKTKNKSDNLKNSSEIKENI